ncbi:MAG: hypothetical protein HYU64_04430 [Armatimonadetes bacterium]|nr:hypothetical protein [Armatimonadota bacterium]
MIYTGANHRSIYYHMSLDEDITKDTTPEEQYAERNRELLHAAAMNMKRRGARESVGELESQLEKDTGLPTRVSGKMGPGNIGGTGHPTEIPSRTVGGGDLSDAQELNIRKFLAKHPAGAVEMKDGTLFPVRTCSKDMKNTCHISVLAEKGDEFRVFLLDKDNTTWRFNFQNVGSNVEFLGKQLWSSPTCFEDGTDASPALQAFTFRVTKKEYAAKSSVFEKIAIPTHDNESERIVGRTNVKVVSQIPQLRG